MKISAELQEYFDFLGWLQQEHPNLNANYWQHITIPEAGQGVSVARFNLEQSTFDQLHQVRQDYYNRQPGDIN